MVDFNQVGKRQTSGGNAGAGNRFAFMGTSMLQRWGRSSVFNLFVLSLLGVLLRYKAAFSLTSINYKYLLNAHSHFAFTGWISTAIYTVLLYMLVPSGKPVPGTYRILLWVNQVSAYGMLVSFTWQGYGPVSIVFSALSVLVSYVFAVLYWRDAKGAGWPPALTWTIRFALIFLILSSAGPYFLAYSMSHAVGNMAFYYNAIYLFLHFQYNGWFSFAAIGAFIWLAPTYGWALPKAPIRWFVLLMGVACIPAYSQSLLWTAPPAWVRVLAACSGGIQLAALACLKFSLWQAWHKRRHSGRSPADSGPGISPAVKVLWLTAYFSFAIKLLLQALSVIPALGRLAFGFRPVIIAYLHLVLLGFLSLFFLGFMIATGLIRVATKHSLTGLWIFFSGVLFNEIFLLIQSLLGFGGQSWHAAAFFLLGAAIWMAAGLFKLVRIT